MGAVLSVLLQFRHATLTSLANVTRASAFQRIALGWLFAAALLALVKGGVVNVFDDPTRPLIGTARPEDEAAVVVRSWFFWGALGFLAGFNERWVPNLLFKDAPRDPDPGSGTAGAGASPTASDGRPKPDGS